MLTPSLPRGTQQADAGSGGPAANALGGVPGTGLRATAAAGTPGGSTEGGPVPPGVPLARPQLLSLAASMALFATAVVDGGQAAAGWLTAAVGCAATVLLPPGALLRPLRALTAPPAPDGGAVRPPRTPPPPRLHGLSRPGALDAGLLDDDGVLTALLRLDPPADLLSPDGGTVPLSVLAQALHPADVELASVQLVQSFRSFPAGAAADGTPVAPPVRRRSWVVLRLDPELCPTAVAARGGGSPGAQRALVRAAEELCVRLGGIGVTATVSGPEELASALTAGTDDGSAFPLRPAALGGLRHPPNGSSQEVSWHRDHRLALRPQPVGLRTAGPGVGLGLGLGVGTGFEPVLAELPGSAGELVLRLRRAAVSGADGRLLVDGRLRLSAPGPGPGACELLERQLLHRLEGGRFRCTPVGRPEPAAMTAGVPASALLRGALR